MTLVSSLSKFSSILKKSVTRRGLLKGALLGGVGALLVKAAGAEDNPAATPNPRVREYWLCAEAFQHNIIPSKHDPLMNLDFKPEQTTYWAIGYRAYTPNWAEPLPASDDIGPNSGIPGPIIRAEVGDTVRINLKNDDSHYKFPHSLHCHGFQYNPDSDGAYIAQFPNAPGTNIAYGSSYVYEYQAVESSVGTWVYHDHSVPQMLSGSTAAEDDDDDNPNKNMDMDMSASPPKAMPELNAELGMFGMIAITDKDTPPVDREFFLFMHDYYASNIPDLAQDLDAFNGQSYLGNTPTFEAKVGDRVRWRVAALGKEFHAFHIHAHRWKRGDKYIDVEGLVPASTLTIDYVEDKPGKWLYHCHITDHMMGGMAGYYLVTDR